MSISKVFGEGKILQGRSVNAKELDCMTLLNSETSLKDVFYTFKAEYFKMREGEEIS